MGRNLPSGRQPGLSFTPDDDGSYVITLTVTDADGGVGTDNTTITVLNIRPDVSILVPPGSKPEGTRVFLTSSVTDSGTTDVHSYFWVVTREGVTVETGTEASFDFTPVDNGDYTVTLHVADDNALGSDTVILPVGNVDPTAEIIGAPASSLEGSPISLSAQVTDPGADSFAYAWRVTKDGSPYATGTTAVFSFTPDDNGSYVISLVVTDDDGGAGNGTPETVVVGNVAPTILVEGEDTVAEGDEYTLTLAAISDPGDDTVSEWIVDWGDGTSDRYSTGGEKTHTYADENPTGTVSDTYTISVDLVDEDGTHTQAGGKSITVTNVAPTAQIVDAPTSGFEGTAIDVTARVSDPGTDSFEYAWSVTKDGSPYATGTTAVFSFTPDDDGSYVISLGVRDDDGGAGNGTPATVVVGNVVPTILVEGEDTVAEGDEYTLTLAAISDPGDDTVSEWIVDWGDGTSDRYSTGGEKTHTYADENPTGTVSDTYTISVDLVDEDGTHTQAGGKGVTVTNVAPTAQIVDVPSSGSEGTAINVTAQVSDPGADGFAYHWTVTKDGASYINGTATNFSFTPDDDGSYEISLAVTDDDTGTGQATPVTVSVLNVRPTITLAGSDTVDEDVDYTLTLGAVADPGSDTVTQWIVHWGDGSSDTYTAGGDRAHVYADDGTYTITVDLVDEDGTHAEAGSLGLTVDSVTSPPVDLGQVDFRLMEQRSLAEGSLFYKLKTTDNGLLSLQVDAPSPSESARVKLYDADPDSTAGLSPLAISASDGAGNQRLDWTVSAGETYYLEVYGDNPDFDLRIANLVGYMGTEVTVRGTDDNDTFEFDATASREITVNGLAYDFDPAKYETIVFNGGNGEDAVTLRGGPDTEVARFFPDHGTFGENGFLVTVDDVTAITAHSGGGLDEAYMYDSPGDDTFISRMGYGKLSGDEFTIETFDFMYNYGYATTRDGGTDVAYMEDTSAADKFKFDWPNPGQFFGKMYGGGIYYNRAKYFEQIVATMTDGKDRVRLFDSDGDETFYGQKSASRLVGAGFDVSVSGYDSLIAYASKGNDVAFLEDSDEDDTTRARPHKIMLWGGDDSNPTYEITARKFDEYHFESKHDGYDRAKLHDTVFSDHAYLRSSTASLYQNNGELDLLYEVLDFDWVKLYATDNGTQDTLEKDDPLDFDLVFDPARWEEL